MTLDDLLDEERKRYIHTEAAIRALLPKRFYEFLSPMPTEEEIEAHISACRKYYQQYGTKLGPSSPWIEAYNEPDHWSHGSMG